MDKELFDVVWKIAMIVLLAGAMVFAFVRFDAESVPCIKNPFTYGAKGMAEKYGGSVSCDCTIGGVEGFQKFTFTDKEFNPEPKTTYQSNPLKDYDFTNIQ